jgi:F-type H+/Na+-transporting ATPase subunit alpha
VAAVDQGVLRPALEDALEVIGRVSTRHGARLRLHETGEVLAVGHGTARLTGLPGVRSEELVAFRGGALGMAFNLDEHEVGVILLGEYRDLHAGAEARRTGRVVDVPVGHGMLGRVIDPTGRPLDDQGPVAMAMRWPVEREAPAIMDRAPVNVPLQTGIKVIDALVPVGRGQRELILGDRQTGKTAIALDAILSQRGQDVLCVYCAIGQRTASVAHLIDTLRRHGAMDYTCVVVAAGQASPGLQFIAPYAATSIAEFFVAEGRDVLIVYDDLTKHAQAYRELSLLLRRPPGREAFPGDIFYVHARLLERSTHLRASRGGGSLTALPIIETEAQNLAAYIPTNLISITDGQIYCSPQLFRRGVLPAVDVGTSVSRVGGKAQLPAYRAIAGELRLSYTQFEELEAFSRFGARLDAETLRVLERGRRVREVLKQRQFALVPPADQIVVLLALTSGLFDALPLERIGLAEEVVRRAARSSKPELCRDLELGRPLEDAARAALLDCCRRALEVQVGPVGDGHP